MSRPCPVLALSAVLQEIGPSVHKGPALFESVAPPIGEFRSRPDSVRQRRLPRPRAGTPSFRRPNLEIEERKPCVVAFTPMRVRSASNTMLLSGTVGPVARKYELAPAHGLGRRKDLKRPVRQRHPVLAAGLHPILRHRPDLRSRSILTPAAPQHLADGAAVRIVNSRASADEARRLRRSAMKAGTSAKGRRHDGPRVSLRRFERRLIEVAAPAGGVLAGSQPAGSCGIQLRVRCGRAHRDGRLRLRRPDRLQHG